VLRIERSVSGDEIGSTKTKRSRRITLGATTAAMIGAHLVEFPVRAVLAHRAVSERKRAGINAIVDDAVASGLPY
jgi:hypothetical protein